MQLHLLSGNISWIPSLGPAYSLLCIEQHELSMWYLKDWKMTVFLYYIIIMAVKKLWYIAFCSLTVKIDGLLHFLIIFMPMIKRI